MSERDDPPLIEHNPKEFHVHWLLRWKLGIQMFVLVGIGTLITIWSRWNPNENDWRNAPFFLVWLLLLAWCFVPSSRSVNPESHESPRQSFPFRLGKKLNRVLHYGRRNTTTRNQGR